MASGRPTSWPSELGMALIELPPVSDFNAFEKHMEVNIFQVTLELALSKQERPEFDAIGHGVMVAAAE
jgi:hypothetical protein